MEPCSEELSSQSSSTGVASFTEFAWESNALQTRMQDIEEERSKEQKWANDDDSPHQLEDNSSGQGSVILFDTTTALTEDESEASSMYEFLEDLDLVRNESALVSEMNDS